MCDAESQILSILQRNRLLIDDSKLAEILDGHFSRINKYRELFHIPKVCHLPIHTNLSAEQDAIYLVGQSLGLQPRKAIEDLRIELTNWATLGALAHSIPFEPFNTCDEIPRQKMAKLVGALESEVVLMNTLTINLHVMLTYFYQPTEQRKLIIHEDHIFPSDKYAIDSQIRNNGLDPCSTCVSVDISQPTEDIVSLIDHYGSQVSIILFGHVQYYSGAAVDIRTIVDCAHRHQIIVGFDLAHAVGNIPLSLHDDNVDFAVWCTYKYLCGGPSSVGGMFINERHFDKCGKRLDGWWGSTIQTRFNLLSQIEREIGAAGFRISHPCPFQTKVLNTSLNIIEEIGFSDLYTKSQFLTQYLVMLLQAMTPQIEIITPSRRGAQISLRTSLSVDKVKGELLRHGVMVDGRDDVIRVAPIHLYNTFNDVFQFVITLKQIMDSAAAVDRKP